jgi:hypothetical protein
MMRFVICLNSTSPLLILKYLQSSKAEGHYSLPHRKHLIPRALQPINGTVRLHDNSLVTFPVFDTKHMIISSLSDPSVMNKKNFAEGYNVLKLAKLTIILLITNMERYTLVIHGFLQG